MAGCVGQDQFGRALIAGLGNDGVSTDTILAVDRPTGTALITVDAAGANTIVVISGANAACDTSLVDRALSRATGPGILLLQHEIPPEANAHAIREARRAGWYIILNPAPARLVPGDLLSLVDLIVPNETEAAAITGGTVGDRGNALGAARRLLLQGARAVLLTLGQAGAVYCDGSTALHCPAVVVQAIDTTAAGDGYLGALAAALAEHRALPDSLGFASAAAGLSVTRLGAQPSLGSREEVVDFIERHGMPVASPVA